MPTPSKHAITEEIHTQIWVQWQVLRRNPEYQAAVKTFPAAVRALHAQAEQQRAALGTPPSSADTAVFTAYIEPWLEYGEGMRACQTVLEAYEELSQWLHSSLTAVERTALDTMQGQAYATIFTTINHILAPCDLPHIREAVPPLAAFQRQWGIRFPVEPDIPYAIRPLLWSAQEHLVECTYDTARNVLHLTVSLDAPKKQIMDAIEDFVTHWRSLKKLSSKRRSRLQERTHYEKIFEVYDLHHDGISDAAIARQLWLEEFKSPQRPGAKNPVLQRVSDRIKAAKKLIFPRQK